MCGIAEDLVSEKRTHAATQQRLRDALSRIAALAKPNIDDFTTDANVDDVETFER